MPARLQAALMFWSSSARASIPMRARISCSRAVTVVLLVVRVRLRTPNTYHRSAVGALYAFRPVLSGDLPLNTNSSLEQYGRTGQRSRQHAHSTQFARYPCEWHAADAHRPPCRPRCMAGTITLRAWSSPIGHHDWLTDPIYKPIAPTICLAATRSQAQCRLRLFEV